MARRRLAAHFVQRRRADVRAYLHEDTPFPERQDLLPEPNYRLSPEYRAFFERVLRYARERVADTSGGELHRRVRWWSVLALLRSIGSSPAAAAATLRSRAASAEAATPEEADAIGRHTVLDLIDDEPLEGADVAPGAAIDQENDGTDATHERRHLLELAREADTLAGASDAKLQAAIPLVEALVREGFRPIVFCRFIPTAEYVARALRERLSGVEVAAVTGTLPPAEREERVAELCRSPRRVLVATDCLSEGINLQEGFDAVMHYDLSWNPTRHEQREGRVDRYGQPGKTVRVLTYYGRDNQIDGLVLDVLLRKHQAIRNSLGVSVPVPVDGEQVIEAILEGLLRKDPDAAGSQALLPGFESLVKPRRDALFQAWDNASETERRSRTLFAQETIRVEEVAAELEASRAASGSHADVEHFLRDGLATLGATAGGHEILDADLAEAPAGLRDALGVERIRGRFQLPLREGELYLSRTHPLVEGLASYVLDTALDPLGLPVAARCGAIRAPARSSSARPCCSCTCATTSSRGAGTTSAACWPRIARCLPSPALRSMPPGSNPMRRRRCCRRGPLPTSASIRRQASSSACSTVLICSGRIWTNRRATVARSCSPPTSGSAAPRDRRATHVEPHLLPDLLGAYVYLPA